MKVALDEASIEQLREFCDIQNLPYPARANTALLRSLVERAGFTEIALPDTPKPIDVVYAEAPASVDLSDPQQVDPSLKPYLRVELMLHQNGENDKHPVPVDVDGRMMVIPRGRREEVPYKYYEALFHAKRVEYDETKDGVSETGLGASHTVQSYPFQVFRIFEDTDPSRRRAIDNWVAQMRTHDAENFAALKKRREKAAAE